MASPDEVWLVDFGDPHPGEPASLRPALVIGPHPSFGADFPFVILIPLTTARRGLSIHVEIEPTPETGLDETGYAQCEMIRSVHRRRLVQGLGAIDRETAEAVTVVVRTLLGH